MRWLIAALLVLLCSTEARAINEARIIDGDTLVLNNIHYRLEGIDAPESTQLCGVDSWHAGAVSASYLRALVRDRHIICRATGDGKYGRTLGLCYADGIDVGSEMVRAGYAYAYTHYSKRYIVEEAFAKAEGRGVHAHACQLPWEWRRAHK